MKTSKIELIELGAEAPFLERIFEQVEDAESVVNVADLIGGKITYSDLLWLAGKKFTSARLVRFACDCALLNIEKIKSYTDKYDAILTFLRNPSEAEAEAEAVARAYDADDDAEAIYWATEATEAATAAAIYAVAKPTKPTKPTLAIYAIIAPATYAVYAVAATCAAFWAAKVSRESKQKVDDLLREMFNEINARGLK